MIKTMVLSSHSAHPKVAIVGRPNVGKSTLFNRLSRSKNAIVDDQPGITRDRLYASVTWANSHITLIDTAGFDQSDDAPMQEQIRKHVSWAIEEADRIIFMVDGHDGIMPGDEEIASLLRRSRKQVFLAVNKIDGPEHDPLVMDFFQLGIEKAFPLSAAHGYGLKALMEEVTGGVPGTYEEETGGEEVKVAILGRPNVGKSSLINRILGFERVLVSELPGTTRDSVDISIRREGKRYLLIDTAGIRRKARVKEKLDKFSMIKALESLNRCHIAIVVLDSGTGVAEQDARICGYALERGRGIILALNKWDMVKADPKKRKHLDDQLDRQLNFISFVPTQKLSALTGERVGLLFETIDLLYTQYCHRVSTGVLNRTMEEIILKKPPPRAAGTKLKIYFATQVGIRPPTFVVFVNRPESVHFSYERFVINQFREHFDLRNTPIKVLFKRRGD